MNDEPLQLRFHDLEPWHATPEELSLRKSDASYGVEIVIGSRCFVVATNLASTAEWIARRFYDMRARSSAHRHAARALHVYALSYEDGAYFWAEDGVARQFMRCALSPHVTAFFAECVMTLSFFHGQAAMGLHAAALACDERALAIVGTSGAGKTTTALACSALGMQLYSDERCVLKNGVVGPFLRSLTVRPQGRRMLRDDALVSRTPFAALISRLDEDGECESIFPPSLLPQYRTPERADLRALVVLRGYAQHPELRPCKIFDVLPFVLQQITCREEGLERMARVMHELRGVALYEMSLGSPGESAAALKCLVTEKPA